MLQDSLPGIIRDETSSLGWDDLHHRSWILLKYGDKETYDALSSQLVLMNHGNKPSAVTVTTLVYKLFLKVSTHPAKLTWLGLTFSGSKGGGKTPNMLLGSQEFQQDGEVKTAGTLWESCLCTVPDRAGHQSLQVSWNKTSLGCIARSYGRIHFSSISKLICYLEKWMQVTHCSVEWENLDVTQTHKMQFLFLRFILRVHSIRKTWKSFTPFNPTI